jgi:hypothetical protein
MTPVMSERVVGEIALSAASMRAIGNGDALVGVREFLRGKRSKYWAS